MIDLAVTELNKYYGSTHVIKGITFEIYSGEKIGLLGRNGSGKTTLFKIITGEERFESGDLFKASGKKIEMSAQIPAFGANDTSEDILRSSFKEIADTLAEMKEIEGDENPAVLKRYGRLMEEYERLGGYDTEVKLNKVCNGMKIDEQMRKSLFSQLSGGEKARVNLARILLRDCDILLLDEPTNHLDLASLEWLEKFLREFSGTVVIISHDRVFLDNVIKRVIEIDNGKAHFYSGNYSWYVQEKERRLISQTEQYERQQREIKRLEDRAKWFVEHNRFTTKHHAILSRIDHMDKIEKPVTARALTAEFDSGGYAVREIASFDSVRKSYGTKVLLDHFDSKIYRNDRIALIGANGCGKSTLLKMIMNEESCDSGTVKVGINVKVAYLPQIVTFENENATVLDTLCSGAGILEEKARSILAGFNFTAPDVIKRVSTLSGGEKSRLRLCLIMQNHIHFLLLDEPTNHLDIASREWIENVLADFDGTMLFVSHDRYFLNKFASKVWSMENGIITKFDHGFEEYSEATRPVEMQKGKNRYRKPAPKGKANIHPAKPVSPEILIAEAETELRELDTEIESTLLTSDFLKIHALYEQKSQLEERIEFLYDEWLEKEVT